MKKLPTVFVPLRSMWLAPTRCYLKPIKKSLPFRGYTFTVLKEWVPSQPVMVLQRTLFSENWILLLLVGGRMLWEWECDVKLWRRAT